MKIKECMCNDVCCVSKNTKVSEIAKLMAEKHIGSVPICDDNSCVCGIVTDRDIILRAICGDDCKDIKETTASEIMTKNVCTCYEDDKIEDAEKLMCEYHVRRLPVCDCDNKIVGILTLGDLINNNQEIGKEEVAKTVETVCNCHTKKHAE